MPVDVFLRDARVVQQLGDNSCLFHSLSYCMWCSGVVMSEHDGLSGFELREDICNFLRDNGNVLVSLTPDVVVSISEALAMDGSSCEAYYLKMMNRAEWGGSFEIAILAEMYSIGVSVYERTPTFGRFHSVGSFRCCGFSEGFHMMHILYTGNCHYDSLVGGSIADGNMDDGVFCGSRSVLAQEMLSYNIGITRMWKQSKKSKLSASAVLSSADVNKKACLGILRSSNVCVEQIGLVLLKGARIMIQPCDSSSLFNALSYCMWYDGVAIFDHDELSGFELRENMCNFLRVSGHILVNLAPDVVKSISEALLMDGFSCEAYYKKLLSKGECGGPFEIAVLAEMFSIGVSVYERMSNDVFYRLLGSYKCRSFDVDSHMINILYNGDCYYGSLVDGVRVNADSEGVDCGGPISIVAEEMLEYNRKVVQLCKKSKNMKQSRSKISSSLKRTLSEIPGNYGISSDLVSSSSSTGISRSRPSVMLRFTDTSGCDVHERRRICKERRDLVRQRKAEAIERLPSVSERRGMCASDSLHYSKNYDDATRFIVCAMCGHEGSISGCKTLVEFEGVIKNSGLKERFLKLTSVGAHSSAYDIIFIEELKSHFNDGLIKGLEHLCGSCCHQLKSMSGSLKFSGQEIAVGADVEVDACEVNNGLTCDSVLDGGDAEYGSFIPKLALFNGLFTGSIPVELTGLTSVEESMINIYSAITKMVPAGGKHYKMKGCTCYTIINDLASVAQRLPRMPSIEDTAILRHKKDLIGKDYTYRPFKVFTALTWLKKHNHLYEEIDLVWPNDVLFWQSTVCSVDIPFIEITDGDVIDYGDDSSDDELSSNAYTTNSGINFFGILLVIFLALLCSLWFLHNFFYCVGSGGMENEILLEVPDTVVSHIEDLCRTLIDPAKSNVERRNSHEFVCQFKNPEFYLSRCFATLYPYGRGCPSDKSSGFISVAKYTKHMLCLGGGPSPRRFQQSSNFIFTLYNMEMKRKIGGVAYIAQKKNLDGSVLEPEVAPNISDINNLLSYLADTSENNLPQGPSVVADGVNGHLKVSPSVNKHDEMEMQKLIKRLIPYSQSLQGSVSHISHERNKLMAMIPSPIINNMGMWRLFFTVAPADMYENRFYEVVQSPICDNTIESWKSRTEKVIFYIL